MKRFCFLVGCCLLGLATGACGPLHIPMPPRLDDEHQRAIDESWEKALTPVDGFDHQALLDILIGTTAYQAGVDQFMLRSEKKFSGGTVIMEVQFNRFVPNMDRFEVTILDRKGHPIRHETYSRDNIETTYRELFVEYGQLCHKGDHSTATPEELRKLAGNERRLFTIEQVFPRPKEKDKQDTGPDRNAGSGQQRARSTEK